MWHNKAFGLNYRKIYIYDLDVGKDFLKTGFKKHKHEISFIEPQQNL